MSLAKQIVGKAISSAIKKTRRVSFCLDKNEVLEYVLDNSISMRKIKPAKPSTPAPIKKRPNTQNIQPVTGLPMLVRTQSDRFKNFKNPLPPPEEPEMNPRQVLEQKNKSLTLK
jgi:hypothetical protein